MSDRDAAHANDGSISPIFNKKKEQNRLRQAQLIGELGSQAMDVIRTQGDIAGLKAQTDPKAQAEAKAQLGKEGRLYTQADVMDRAHANAMKQYATFHGIFQVAAIAHAAPTSNPMASKRAYHLQQGFFISFQHGCSVPAFHNLLEYQLAAYHQATLPFLYHQRFS
ncbi:MAG: hypothetical protein ACN6O8_01330 [Achromobacter sp.]|uniref:hypothetical protein n=1 Tax=Achromobacter sp. TaxID=134375 RepID=UPI003D01C256